MDKRHYQLRVGTIDRLRDLIEQILDEVYLETPSVNQGIALVKTFGYSDYLDEATFLLGEFNYDYGLIETLKFMLEDIC